MTILLDCTIFKESFESAAHYDDSLVHLLKCLPLPEPMLRHGMLPGGASSHSSNSPATARSSGGSNVDYLSMSPWYLPLEPNLGFSDTSTSIPKPSIAFLGSSATIDEELPVTADNQPLALIKETSLSLSICSTARWSSRKPDLILSGITGQSDILAALLLI
jgi:hypothetical protein